MEAASAGPVLGPFYTHDGDPSLVDATQWPQVPGYATGDGRPLYRFAQDTPGGAPTGDGAGGVWHVYSGPVNAATPEAANAASPAPPPIPASATAAPGSPAAQADAPAPPPAAPPAATPDSSPANVQSALLGLLKSAANLADALTDLVRSEIDRD